MAGDRGAQHTLPVLTYHSVDDSGSAISTAPAEFRRQIDVLAGAGWHTLTVDEMLAGHFAGEWPARSLMITFDDGYRNVLERAIPVLVDCGFSAVVFVVSDRAGGTPRWADQPTGLKDMPLLGWPELRDVLQAGCAIGSHSCTHPRLPSLRSDELENEVSRSKHEIENRCGISVDAFAYPYGAATDSVQRVVGRHYRAAFGTTLAQVDRRSRRTHLERLDAYYLRGASWIDRLDGLTAKSYLAARRLGRATRAAWGRQDT